MKRSQNRILTTHTGRLERPTELTIRMAEHPEGRPSDLAFEELLRNAVADVVKRQADAGVDIVTDGEFGKLSWNLYVTSRLSGWEQFEGAKYVETGKDRRDFAQYYEDSQRNGVYYFKNPAGKRQTAFPVFTGPIRYTGHNHLQTDIENLKAARDEVAVEDVFLPSTAPGSVFYENRFYKNRREFVFALADALKEEYRAIVDAGFVLHIDDPMITTFWDNMLPDADPKKFQDMCADGIEALNYALAGINPERVRMHVCWGSWHGPHSTDVPLRHVLPILSKANVGGYVLEAGNVRHEHEWQVWKDAKLPEGRILIPGMVSHSTDTIEHPELVAWRLRLYADVVGRENIIAGTDCGLGYRVHPQIAWAKLKALAEGAALASRQLWPRKRRRAGRTTPAWRPAQRNRRTRRSVSAHRHRP
jgi:5-methyltetrahydropteroyltriglutamate--homocysteine methyltransferase